MSERKVSNGDIKTEKHPDFKENFAVFLETLSVGYETAWRREQNRVVAVSGVNQGVIYSHFFHFLCYREFHNHLFYLQWAVLSDCGKLGYGVSTQLFLGADSCQKKLSSTHATCSTQWLWCRNLPSMPVIHAVRSRPTEEFRFPIYEWNAASANILVSPRNLEWACSKNKCSSSRAAIHLIIVRIFSGFELALSPNGSPRSVGG